MDPCHNLPELASHAAPVCCRAVCDGFRPSPAPSSSTAARPPLPCHRALRALAAHAPRQTTSKEFDHQLVYSNSATADTMVPSIPAVEFAVLAVA